MSIASLVEILWPNQSPISRRIDGDDMIPFDPRVRIIFSSGGPLKFEEDTARRFFPMETSMKKPKATTKTKATLLAMYARHTFLAKTAEQPYFLWGSDAWPLLRLRLVEKLEAPEDHGKKKSAGYYRVTDLGIAEAERLLKRIGARAKT